MQVNEVQISELLSLLLIFSFFTKYLDDDGEVLSRSAVSNDSQVHFYVDLLKSP